MAVRLQTAAASQARAILLMLGAILLFSLMDATVKALAPRIGIMPTLWARYAGQMLIVLIIVSPRLTTVVRTAMPGMQLLRSLLLLCATGCFFTGISLIALTDAAALMATNPVFITLGAALFLGERIGLRRAGGILAALVGAMIVIRPGSDIFTPAALFPLAAAISYSGYALLTRRVGHSEDVWTSLFYTALVGTVLLTAAVPFFWVPMQAIDWLLIVAVAGLATSGQLLLIRALSQGEAAMLAPYSYVGLILATAWGILFFAEWPDLWSIVGMLVIAGAGLYVWHRETASGT
ncbi:MAG: DMT family transporter [Rhodobacteraceae bacterium]|nr:MAG: DMT family transporter [Paracoccaceae bacterium]